MAWRGGGTEARESTAGLRTVIPSGATDVHQAVSTIDPTLMKRLEAAVQRLGSTEHARIAERGPDAVVLMLPSDILLDEASLEEVRRRVHALCVELASRSRSKAG